jgi:hypothetical protein
MYSGWHVKILLGIRGRYYYSRVTGGRILLTGVYSQKKAEKQYTIFFEHSVNLRKNI